MEIHQIVFRWSEELLVGRRGLGPVASSLDGQQLVDWSVLLRAGDFVQGMWTDGAANAPAVGALQIGPARESGVIVRVLPVRDANGRMSELIHVLIGPASVLTGRLAVGLWNWPGWVRPETADTLAAQMPSIPSETLETEARDTNRALHEVALRHPLLPNVAADVLNAPSAHYQLILPPQTGPEDDMAAHLTYGLLTALGDFTGEEPWTFLVRAELKVREADARLMVVERAPSPSAFARRRRVSLRLESGAAANGPVSVSTAGSVIAAIADGRPVTYPRTPLLSAQDSADWADTQLLRLSGVANLLRRAVRGQLTAKEEQDLAQPAVQLGHEFRTCSPAETADVLRLWRDFRSYPRTREVLVSAGVRCALNAARREAPETESLMHAVQAMSPPAGTVESNLADLYRHGQKPDPNEVSRVLIAAATIGVDAQNDPTVGWLLAGLEPYVLVQWSIRLIRPEPVENGRPRPEPDLAAACLQQVRMSRIDSARRRRCRQILLDDRGMAETVEMITPDPARRVALYGKALPAAYEPPHRAAGVEEILDDLQQAGASLSETVWHTLYGMSADPVIRFAVAAGAIRRGHGGIGGSLLSSLSMEAIVDGAANLGGEPEAARQVIDHLLRRMPAESGSDIAHARGGLLRHGHLIGPVSAAYPASPEQARAFRGLLKQAYGPNLSADTVREIYHRMTTTSPGFVEAMLSLATSGGREEIVWANTRLLVRSSGGSWEETYRSAASTGAGQTLDDPRALRPYPREIHRDGHEASRDRTPPVRSVLPATAPPAMAPALPVLARPSGRPQPQDTLVPASDAPDTPTYTDRGWIWNLSPFSRAPGSPPSRRIPMLPAFSPGAGMAIAAVLVSLLLFLGAAYILATVLSGSVVPTPSPTDVAPGLSDPPPPLPSSAPPVVPPDPLPRQKQTEQSHDGEQAGDLPHGH
ncbi:hypothetical protein ACQPYK_18990 [Streptosporangium sp. CA-135522]|uniref:hypothetical protein n=1 Tax=Streptosporangium sp. CA-135522 TaxID=3240072 RepID=UPI003D8ECF88